MEAAQSSEIPLDLFQSKQKHKTSQTASIFRLLTVAKSNLDLALDYNKRTLRKLSSIKQE